MVEPAKTKILEVGDVITHRLLDGQYVVVRVSPEPYGEDRCVRVRRLKCNCPVGRGFDMGQGPRILPTHNLDGASVLRKIKT